MLRGRSLLAYFSECAKVWSLPMVFEMVWLYLRSSWMIMPSIGPRLCFLRSLALKMGSLGRHGVFGCVASEEEVVFVSGIVAVFCAVGWRFGCWS